MMSTRVAYGQALADLGAKKDFLVLDADLSKATRTIEFVRKISSIDFITWVFQNVT